MSDDEHIEKFQECTKVPLISTVVSLLSGVMQWIPRYNYSHETPSIFTCNLSLLFNAILLSTMTIESWLAVLFWLLAGLVLVLQSLVPCDIFCCLCLEYSGDSSQATMLIDNDEIMSRHTQPPKVYLKATAPPIGSSIVNRVQTRR